MSLHSCQPSFDPVSPENSSDFRLRNDWACSMREGRALKQKKHWTMKPSATPPYPQARSHHYYLHCCRSSSRAIRGPLKEERISEVKEEAQVIPFLFYHPWNLCLMQLPSRIHCQMEHSSQRTNDPYQGNTTDIWDSKRLRPTVRNFSRLGSISAHKCKVV